MSRRRLLAQAKRLAFAALLAPAACQSFSRAKFDDTPFPLGVASGEPAPDGVVIWTRAVADERPESLEIAWEVAADPKFARLVRRGTAAAVRERAHCVHVEVAGLAPGRPYWYRFRAGGEVSPVGRAFTAPEPGAPLAALRIAVASCQHYEQGYYTAYRGMVRDDPQLVLHLGDYIYESSWGTQVRRTGLDEPWTLAEYRALYDVYKRDPDLQAAHAACPWAVTWDDHEVDNDYAADQSQDYDDPTAFLKRRAAAYQAYYEHLPLRALARPEGPDSRLYRRLTFGRLVEFNVLDTRQYRADHACDRGDDGGGREIEPCAEWYHPGRSLLGSAQEAWLEEGLARSRARWNVLAQQVPMASYDRIPGPGERYWNDAWDGYAPAREKLLRRIAAQGLANPVVLSGDIHSFWVNDLKPDFKDHSAPAVATEFITTSISSRGIPYDRFAQFRPENPHVRHMESRFRGYLLCEVTPQLWLSELRAVSDVTSQEAALRSLGTYVVENGRPGALPDGVSI